MTVEIKQKQMFYICPRKEKKMELPFLPALCPECVSCPLKFRSNFADRDSVIIGSSCVGF